MLASLRKVLVVLFLTVAAVASFADASGAFKRKGNFFKYGDWYLHRSADDDVTIYNSGRTMAVEIIAGSSGWWHIMSEGCEYIVWSGGDTDQQDFFTRSWEEDLGNPITVSSGDYFTIADGDNTTRIDCKGNNIIVLLADGAKLAIPKTGDDIRFDTYDGDVLYYPDAIDVSECGGGELGGDDEAMVYAAAGPLGWIGRRASIVDAGEVYSTINETDCLTWPDRETMELAGQAAWGDYYPSEGDTGTVVWTSLHCDSQVPVAVLLVDGNYVCIGLSGLELTSWTSLDEPYIVSDGY
jgi:hypothetical protein